MAVQNCRTARGQRIIDHLHISIYAVPLEYVDGQIVGLKI
jgi:hypothetical protein